MEKHINGTVEKYTITFKDDLKHKIIELGIDHGQANELIEFVYEYPRLVFEKNDLTKRKRVKNAIPEMNRCNALRANGEQCTRRRKEDCEFCGTHAKGAPHGYYNENNDESETSEKKIEVVAQEILGIVYFIDANNNVYRTEDILENKVNPQIIAKCVRNNGKLTIPELGLV